MDSVDECRQLLVVESSKVYARAMPNRDRHFMRGSTLIVERVSLADGNQTGEGSPICKVSQRIF